MAPTLKASKSGLAKIQQARNEKGWTVEDQRWLIEASKILSPEKDWQLGNFCYANGCSETTWKRFLRGTAVGSATFKAFCQVLGLNWEEVVDRNSLEETNLNFVQEKQPKLARYLDLNEAPDIRVFCGRNEELATLKQWILKDGCRLVALLGMGGIGKTALSVKLAQQLQDNFEFVIWRSLRHAPPFHEFLTNLMQSLSSQLAIDIPPSSTISLSQFRDYLRKHRWLIVLDNYEGILRGGDLAGQYLQGYEKYGELLRLVGESNHNSCLLLTSRENPQEIASFAGENLTVRSQELNGLKPTEAEELLLSQNLAYQKESNRLIALYRGNPLALKMVANTIKQLFQGNIMEFLSQNTLVIGDVVRNILTEQFERLSSLEKEITYWLAVKNRPVSLRQLQKEIFLSLSNSEFIEALESLGRRCLVEKNIEGEAVCFSLQPVVMKYVTKQLIAQVCTEIVEAVSYQTIDNLELLRTHALLTSFESEKEINCIQLRMIITPIINNLKSFFKDENRMTAHLYQILSMLPDKSSQFVGYARDNIVNLLK